MRHLTLEYIAKLVHARPGLSQRPRPEPMPGRKWPTRVAWYFEIADRGFALDKYTGKMQPVFTKYRTHSYVGKPNRYRALEARKFLRCTVGSNNTLLLQGWQAEFDRAGLVAYKILGHGQEPLQLGSPSFFAYHPHSSDVEIMEAFCKPLFLKYVGGLRLYSQKRKLQQESIDAYYNWYFATFKRRLRRPKAIETAIVAGENPGESLETPNPLQDG